MQASEFTPENDSLKPKPGNKIGRYVDPESGKELVATSTPQADAFVRLGWERQDDRPEMVASTGKTEKQDVEILQGLRKRATELGISPEGSIQSLRARIGLAEKDKKKG